MGPDRQITGSPPARPSAHAPALPGALLGTPDRCGPKPVTETEMKLLQSLPTLPALPIGRGLGAALALLLLLMGLGTALSSRQSQEQLQTLALLEQTALPSARLLHELIGQVDE